MKILFFFVHPGAFHVLKRTIANLQEHGHDVDIAIINKDVLPELLQQNNIPFRDIFPEGRKSKNMIQAFINLLKTVWRLHKFTKGKCYDLFVTDDCLSINGWLSRTPTLFLIDDDIDVVPEIAPLLFCATKIYAPAVTRLGRFAGKKLSFNGYKELSYLHPDYFQTSIDVIKKYNLVPGEYVFIRVVGLTATHDRNKRGIDNSLLHQIVDLCIKYGKKPIISAERDLEEMEKYRLKYPAIEGLHILANAAIFVGDSQTMTSEAALLGVPALRCNDFVGKISVMEEKENRYGLTCGFLPENSSQMLLKLEEWLGNEHLRSQWQRKYHEMLSQTVDIPLQLQNIIKNFSTYKGKSE